MQWSFPIGRLAGSEIRIHLTFFLLLLWIGIAHFQLGGAAAAVEGIAFVVAIFACVVLHELGHAVAAGRYGIATPRITLLPIGGVAELERMPEKPSEEIVVALAGPLVNVVIAAVLFLVLGARVDAGTLAAMEDPAGGFVARLAAVNIVLVLFNLIPAFPMDGGRVLRALLATRYPRVRATQIAGTVGQFAAFAFGFLGLVGGNPLLIFVAIFVYLAATAETRVVGLQDAARSVAIRDAMITSYEALAPTSTLSHAAELLLRTTQHEFPVLDGSGRLRGVLTRAGLVEGMRDTGADAPVIEAMVRDIPSLRGDGRLDAALEALQKSGAPAVAIIDDDDRFLGYVTMENIGELMMLRAAATTV
ncbi:CBS domain-containing protein [Nitratireductor sp. CAU 1489]|uniref:Zinc metalloprotease n=1 Tax=Nitratireductor arenosus TaxID=2682096 RepID=A0A844QC80_9HYPH|nr:site-2 protease family protein [Nitratireductor arenosus]MVA96587.1 CBS domain-containing protein [Nitratireductor arenosus]